RFILLFLDPVAALELGKKPDTLAYKERKAIPYIRYQKQLMRLVNLANRFLPEFIFAPRELEAKNVAYANPNAVIDGAVIPMFSQEHGRVVYYTLKGQIHKSGLHAYLFTSLEEGDFPAKLIFRGTNGPASIGRDLDTQGIGKRVFEGNREKIIALANEGKTDRIEVLGHSLGAADAQRATMLLADPESGCDFKEISLFAFCSPKLELEAIQKWENVLEQLSQKEQPPSIHLNFAYHENDAATWMGDKYLTGASHEFVTRRYFVVKSKSGSSDTKAHHTNPFFKYGNFDDTVDERTFVFLRSFPKEIYLRKLRETDACENRGFLSRFVINYLEGKKETQEEIEKEWAEREKDKVEIAKLEKKVTQTSTAVRAGMTAASYTVHPVLYQAYRLGQNLTAWWGS
ncbi:MAG: hypothetical protein KDK63_01030, partial [Chlamydiia bacterium]|nr:hypothetical protein [Chlamydiia bacterium]